jgi:NADPH:quinone reductase-like Zn-dependent oxidoreductase
MQIPQGLTFEEASSILVNYPTNYIGLVHRVNLKKGKHLIYGNMLCY